MNNDAQDGIRLSPLEEQRARDLHDRSVVIFAHDHLWRWQDLEAMREGGVTAKTVKLTVDGIEWLPTGHRVKIPEFEGWTRRALVALDSVYRLAEEHPNEVVIARTTSDIADAKRDGKIALVIGCEGSRPLEGSLEVLRSLHRLGLREMQLTWASPNQLITDDGLNDFGREVVREMNRLGILIDLSHLRDPSYFQTLELSAAPLIVSHNACRSLTNYGDTLSDEKIAALAEKGGVLALHFVSGDYIKPRHGTPTAVMDDLIDHVDHIRQLVGVEHVALGGDYFLAAPEERWAWVKEVESPRLMLNVTRGLITRGYAEAEIQGILGGNLLDLYERVWRTAA